MRTFLAVPISPKITEKIAEVQSGLMQQAPELAWTRATNFHLTLLFLGEQSRGDLDEISKKLDHISWPSAFTLYLDRLGIFGSLKRPRVLWLGPGEGEEKIRQLALIIRRALRADEDFKAHLTLARFRRGEAVSLKSAVGKLEGRIELPVEKVVLFESRLGAGPPRYLPRKSWNLEGAE